MTHSPTAVAATDAVALTAATPIVAIGESLVDVVVPADGGPACEHPGGSPMNIAFGLARLGRPVTLVSELGTDARGAAIAEHLRRAGVRLADGSVRAGATSTATAHLRADGSADYVFDLHWSLPEALTPADPVLRDAGIVHAGSIGGFLEPGGTAVTELLAGLAERGVPPLIALDPNIRPSIVPDRPAALARFEQLAALAAVLKLSDEDAAWLYPHLDLAAAARHLLDLGPGLVALTRGGEGALLVTPTARADIPGVAVRVADTIGAGDSFMSALLDRLAGLLDEGVAAAALRNGSAYDPARLHAIGDHAVRCAAITVSRPGANPPTRDELAALARP